MVERGPEEPSVGGSSPSLPTNADRAPFRVLRVNLRSMYRYKTVAGEALGIIPKNFAKHLHRPENGGI